MRNQHMKTQDPSMYESKYIGGLKRVMDGRADKPDGLLCYPQLNTPWSTLQA